MTQVGGGAFSLLNLQLAEWVGAGHAVQVQITGNFQAGGSITTTVTLDQAGPGPYAFQTVNFSAAWSNLASVVFRPIGGTDLERWWALDNVRVDNAPTAVPEPASMAMLGMVALGLMGYGWRRRKAAVSAAV